MNDSTTSVRLVTKAYGEIEVDERQRLCFPYGLIGFERLHDFVLLDAGPQPFYWLQSADHAHLAWVLLDPYLFRPDYSPDVPAEDLAEIGIDDSRQALVLAILTIPDDPQAMTANLQGPILINRRTRVGRQSITGNSAWQLRHRVIDELAAVRQGA